MYLTWEKVTYARLGLYDERGREAERWVEGRGLSNVNSNKGGTWAAGTIGRSGFFPQSFDGNKKKYNRLRV